MEKRSLTNNKKKHPLRSEKLRKIRRKKRIGKTVIFFILIILLIALASYGTHASALSIQSVTTTGNTVVGNDEITNIVNADTTGSYLYIFSKRSILLYPKKKIETDIVNSIKDVKGVSISIDSPHSISVALQERKPTAEWCKGDYPGDPTTEQCYFVADDGYIYSYAPHFSGDVYVKYYGLIDSDNPVGENYIASSTFESLQAFISELNSIKVSPVALVATSTDDEYDIYFTGTSGKIILNDETPFDKIFDNFQTFINAENLIDPATGLLRNFDYIDLRFGNKIYLKSGTENATSSTSSSSTPAQ